MADGSVLEILGMGASVASGGIFGVIGSVIGTAGKYFQERQKQSFKEKEWEYETKMLKLQMDAKAQETEQEIALVAQEGSWSGLRASHEAAAKIGPTHKWVNDVKSLFRPFLTISLWIISGWIFWQIGKGGLNEWFAEGESDELIKYMVYTVFFSASTATMWWFGDRALAPPHLKHR